MSTVAIAHRTHKDEFALVAAPFVDGQGLPFAEVLDVESIETAFRNQNALFGQDPDDVFSTAVVLWAFLGQTLRDGKGAACAAAVSDIATYMLQTGQKVPSGDTGDYCRARAKLSLSALQVLVKGSSRRLEESAASSWLWRGRHAKLVDGFTFTMPDTPENQEAFPQNPVQTPGVGLPIARACAVLSLATGSICDLAIGPYLGKETGESALLRELLDAFDPGDVAVFDRYFCSYMLVAMLSLRGVHVCVRLHQRRRVDEACSRRLGPGDDLVTWCRPDRPAWMSVELYEQIPDTLTLRQVQFDVREPGRRTERLVVVTTLFSPKEHTKADVAELYGFRWNAELDIRVIKQTLNLDHLRCKTPPMVRRELWVTLLAYNLIRGVIATAAVVHEKQPRCLGFTMACQTVLASWMLWSTGAVRDADAMRSLMLTNIAANEVADRPGRIEPRVIKRRRHQYPLMQRPRDVLRAKLAN